MHGDPLDGMQEYTVHDFIITSVGFLSDLIIGFQMMWKCNMKELATWEIAKCVV